MMKRLTLILTSVFLLHGAILAQSSASALFLLIAPGASAGGTGEAHVADASDAYASYWNPAALAFLTRYEVVAQYSQWLPNLASDMAYNYIGGRFNVPEVGTFGSHLIYLDLGEQNRTDEFGNDLGSFRSYMWAGAVGFGLQMSPRSSLGLNVKVVQQNLSPVSTGAEKGKGVSTDFAFDLGYYRMQFLFNSLDLGVAVTNIGPKVAFIDEDQADPMPTNLKMGIKWWIIQSEFNKFALLYDMNKLLVASHPGVDHDGDGIIGGYDREGFDDPDAEYGRNGKLEVAHTDSWYLALFTSWWDDWKFGGDVDLNGNGYIDSVGAESEIEVGNQNDGSFMNEFDTITHNIGIEYWYSSYFAIRAGYIYDKLGKIGNPTFGAGIHYGPYGFDFGYIYGEQGHPLTNTMRFSLNMAF